MKRSGRYILEFGLIAAVMLVMVLGFWDIYFGTEADAQPHHHLHVATAFIWIGLLLTQLILSGSMSQSLTFIATFALFFTLLAATALPAVRQPRPV